MAAVSLCKRCWKRNGIAKPAKAEVVKERDCKLCLGSFLRVADLGGKIVTAIDKVPGAETFSVGTRLTKDSERYEEGIWDMVDLAKAESVKGELNREIGKWVEKNSKYKFRLDPHVRAMIDVVTGGIETQVASVYLYGRYRKLKRNVRQTKRVDSDEKSVEAEIEAPLLRITKGQKAVLHGAGREDIDVLMAGGGRPFVMEVVRPQVRKFDARKAQLAINKSAKGIAAVEALRFCDKNRVEVIKRAKFDKTYEATVELDKPISKPDLQKLPGSVPLAQRTPLRVANRRADLIRKRTVKRLDSIWIDKSHFKLIMTTQSGTYIKEFISGDEGRTQPSVSSMLNRKAKCSDLTVTAIHSEWLEEFW
ncbi:tRNA pseudouridine synthase Pus10 [uncultured archaeon]|nr:tRNA pseudouridine synthase Pus10 [uncultured archaeon]